MPARDLLPLAQPSRAMGEIIVPDFRRRRHRRIAELQRIGVEFVSRIEAERIGLLVERDDVFLAVGEPPHHDAGETVLALQPDQPAGKDREAQDVDAGPMGNDIAPMVAAAVERAVSRRS